MSRVFVWFVTYAAFALIKFAQNAAFFSYINHLRDTKYFSTSTNTWITLYQYSMLIQYEHFSVHIYECTQTFSLQKQCWLQITVVLWHVPVSLIKSLECYQLLSNHIEIVVA